MLRHDEKVINIKQEDLEPVIEMAKSKDEEKTREALVECTKDKFIYDVQFEDNVCECRVWDEIRHDYILELTFDL